MPATMRALWQRPAQLFSTLSQPTTATTRTLPRPSNLPLPRLRARKPHQNPRFQSNKPPTGRDAPPTPASEQQQQQTRQQQRAEAILSRASRWVPQRLRPYLSRLRAAPLSHAAAFLVLHEATAVVPLVGLAYAFHRADWVPTGWVLGPWAAWAEEGLARYARWFRRRGWFGLGGEDDGIREGEERLERRLREEVRREKEKEMEMEDGKGKGVKRWLWFWRGRKDRDDADGAATNEGESKKLAAWRKVREVVTVDNTEKGYKIGIQIAAAYAITKALLIPRIALSLWATPWLARVFIVARRSLRKKPTSK